MMVKVSINYTLTQEHMQLSNVQCRTSCHYNFSQTHFMSEIRILVGTLQQFGNERDCIQDKCFSSAVLDKSQPGFKCLGGRLGLMPEEI